MLLTSLILKTLLKGLLNQFKTQRHAMKYSILLRQGRTIGEMAEMVKFHFPNIDIEYLPKDNLLLIEAH